MKTLWSSIIYENPLPQLCSRQSAFPWLCQCKDGTILASHAIGQAFESVDGATYISKSTDSGKTWSEPHAMFDKSGLETAVTDYAKITTLPDGKIGALGYAYIRHDVSLPIGNPQTGGLLDDFVYFATSSDNGDSWSEMQKIDCVWGPHIEASAPITVLKDGSFITPITNFPRWDGTSSGEMCGRALVSHDGGKSWGDDAVCMNFEGKNVTCYEQRMCQLESGAIICIGWNEDTDNGCRLENHYTVSFDNGKSWSAPAPTGVMGQASSVMALGGEKLLALHAVRRDTDRPGIYAYIIDFSNKKWEVVDSLVVWEPITPVLKDDKMAEIFAFLKFGQPGAIKLRDGSILMSHWFAQDGQYKTVATKIEL